MKSFLFRWGPALGLMLIIFLFSSQPKASLPDFSVWDFVVKKTAHVIEYGVLGVSMLRGVRGNAPLRRAHVVGAFALTLLYASTDEYHQTFVAGREGRALDILIDGLSATIGLTLRLRMLRARLPIPSPNKSESSHR